MNDNYSELIKIVKENNSRMYKTVGPDLEVIERLYNDLEKAKELLNAAECPCCDKSGAYYDAQGEVCQCQWCDEVSKL